MFRKFNRASNMQKQLAQQPPLTLPQQEVKPQQATAQKQPMPQQQSTMAASAQPPQKKITNELVLDIMNNTKKPAINKPVRMAKGGMVKANCGASVPPAQKAKK